MTEVQGAAWIVGALLIVGTVAVVGALYAGVAIGAALEDQRQRDVADD